MTDDIKSNYNEPAAQPLVSVLLPAFNVAKYIARCIESVQQQTWNNMEIIIVDDCSPDESGIIAQRYAANDSRIKVYRHERNLGLSATRNTGLEHAHGEYITFVDSDDWIEPDYIEYLYQIIASTDSDIALCRSFFTSRNHKQAETDTISIITPDDMLCDIFYNRIHEGVWNRLYRRDLLEGHHFRTASKTGEGMQFNTQVIPAAQRIGVGTKRIYTYNVDNETSVTKKPNIEKQALGSVENMDFIKENLYPRSARVDKALEYQYFTTSIYALQHILRMHAQSSYPEFTKKIVRYCRHTAPRTFSMEINIKQRLKSILVWISPMFAARAAIMWRYRLGRKQRV